MKPHADLPTEHRLARLAAWAMAVLAWLLAGAVTHVSRRARLQHVTLAQIRRFVRRLVILRAAQLLPLRAPMRQQRNFAPAGFQRRTNVRFSERRIAGAWLRRQLNRAGLRELIELLRNWRALGAELARRRRKRLTRLFAITPTRPRAHPLRTLAVAAIAATDSS